MHPTGPAPQPIIAEIEAPRDPVLITQHGRPAAYLVGVQTYEWTQRRLDILEGIARGERAIDEGRALSHPQAKKRMSRLLSSSGRWMRGETSDSGCDRTMALTRQGMGLLVFDQFARKLEGAVSFAKEQSVVDCRMVRFLMSSHWKCHWIKIGSPAAGITG